MFHRMIAWVIAANLIIVGAIRKGRALLDEIVHRWSLQRMPQVEIAQMAEMEPNVLIDLRGKPD